MPAEVISLLSSPLSEAQTPPRAKESSPLHRNGPEVTRRTLDDGLIDLTSDTPDRAPWSRSAVGGPRQANTLSSLAVPSALYLSDDFDTTGDLDGGSGDLLFNSPAAKKPRLSLPQDDSDQENYACLGSSELPPVRNSLRPGHPKGLDSVTNLDPVEVSSPAPRAAKSFTKSPGLLNSSVFASSSPIPRRSEQTEDSVARPVMSKISGNGRSPKRPVAWDPISSSAPEQSFDTGPTSSPRRGLHRSVSEVVTVDSSSEDAESSSGEEFPDIEKVKSQVRKYKLNRGSVPKQRRVARATPGPKKSSEEKAREKTAREAEKERKKQERAEARQQRALEKEQAAALAEVNKVRIDKKVSTPEMIVHLPLSLHHTTTVQVETLLKDLDVQFQSWDSPLENVVKWSRKVKSTFNEELGHWEPTTLRIEPEQYALVILPAAEFVKLVLKEEETDVETHVVRMQSRFPDYTLIYLIEGLTPWMRKNRTIRNRQFVSAVRSGLSEEASSSTAPPSSSQPQDAAAAPSRRRRANAAAQTYIDEDTIEDALLDLQVLHGALIHHTALPLETAHQIVTFTQHISTVPYRRRRDDANAANAAFCMESGQVRGGEDAADIYVRMLQEISRVTAPIAYGIAAEFGSVTKLVRGLETKGPLGLEDVRKSANKDGAFSDRRVGQAVSRRLHKVFTGKDDRSMDI